MLKEIANIIWFALFGVWLFAIFTLIGMFMKVITLGKAGDELINTGQDMMFIF